MKAIIPVLTCAILLSSCHEKQSAVAGDATVTIVRGDTQITRPAPPALNTAAPAPAGTTAAARQWLITAIEGTFNDATHYPEDKITTKAYETYKTDATGVGYDGGLTEKEFNKKYGVTHDIKHAGTGVGFLISGQDNGTIQVTKCELIKQDATAYYFKVVITDATYRQHYQRDIKVVPKADAYLIDDVVEYN